MPILKKYYIVVMSNSDEEATINWFSLIENFTKTINSEITFIISSFGTAAEKTTKNIKETVEAAHPENLVRTLTDNETAEKYKTIATKLNDLQEKLEILKVNPLSEEYQKLKLEIDDMQKEISDELTGIGQKFAISLIPEVGPGISSAISNIKSSIDTTYEKLNKISAFNGEKKVEEPISNPIKAEEPISNPIKGGMRRFSKKRRLSITIKKIKKLKEKINRTIKLFQRTNPF